MRGNLPLDANLGANTPQTLPLKWGVELPLNFRGKPRGIYPTTRGNYPSHSIPFKNKKFLPFTPQFTPRSSCLPLILSGVFLPLILPLEVFF